MKPKKTYDHRQKDVNINREVGYMLAKTISMFEYSGLPETLKARDLEKMLQVNGYVFVTEHEGKLYAFNGGCGGELDAYYNPTKIIVSNPWLKLNKEFSIEEDGVFMRSDSMEMGLGELYSKYCTMLIENDINMVMYGYNTRLQKVISASDDRTRANAEVFMKKLIAGDLSVVAENALFDGMKINSDKSGSSDQARALIEYHQYIKASMLNEVGLASNFNMKRERFVAGEVEMQQDTAFPLVYDMMSCRQEAVKQINEKYGLNIEVGFGSVWAVNVKEFADGIANNAPILQDIQVTSTDPVPDNAMGGATAGGVSVEIIDGAGVDSTKEADGGGSGTGPEGSVPEGTGLVPATVDVPVVVVDETVPGSEASPTNSEVKVVEEGGVDVSATEVVTDSSVSGGDVEVDSGLVLDVSDDTDLDNKG